MSWAARVIHCRYGWLAKIDPVFAEGLRLTEEMADYPSVKKLAAWEAAVRRCLDLFDEISWPAGAHPLLLCGLRKLHLRIRSYQAHAGDRQAQLEITTKTFESINAENSSQENKSLLMMAIGWFVCARRLAG